MTYDDIAGRFIVAADTFSGDLLLAVSKDSNPLDGFYDLRPQRQRRGRSRPTITKIGWNADEVVITYNMYSDSTGRYDHVQVLSFAASSIFSSSPPPTLTLGTDYFSYDRSNNDFTLAPASMHGAAPGDPDVLRRGERLRQRLADARGLGGQPAEQLAQLHRHAWSTSIPTPIRRRRSSPAASSRRTTRGSSTSNGATASWSPTRTSACATDSDAHARWYEFNVSGTPFARPGRHDRAGPGDQHLLPGDHDRPGRRHRHDLQRVVAHRVSLGL